MQYEKVDKEGYINKYKGTHKEIFGYNLKIFLVILKHCGK